MQTDVLTSRWTLAHTDGEWVVTHITDTPPGEEAMSTPLIPGPRADVERLHTDSTLELEGIRYVTAPGEAALLAGSQHARHPLRLTWILTLVTDPDIAWRPNATTDPASDLHWLP